MPRFTLPRFDKRHLLQIFLTAAVYFILARFSLLLQFASSNATPIWPPSGFAFAIILLLGNRIAPGITIGAFAANLVTFISNQTSSLPTAILLSFVISIGNTCEALMGRYLLMNTIQSSGINNLFLKVNNVFKFLFAAAGMSLVSCTIGATAISLANIILPGQYNIVWITWWMGDVAGILLVTPFILILKWRVSMRTRIFILDRNGKQIIETAALFLACLLVSGIVFDNWLDPDSIFNLPFWVIPVLVWAAVRFNPGETISALFLCSLIAVWGTISRHGPFAALTFNDALLSVQSFVSISVITTLALSASINERRQSEKALRSFSSQLEIGVKERTAALTRSNFQLAESQRLAHIGSWEWDIKNDVITWSDELYRIYDLVPGEFNPVYENFLKCVHPDDRDFVNEIIQKALRNQQPFDFFHRIIRPDSSVRIQHAIGEVIVDDRGQPTRMAGTAQDVTEQKRAEELVREASVSIWKANLELELKNKELQKMNEELASFSYVASHDLQEPLRKIQIFAKRILETEINELSESGKDYFSRMENAAHRMQQLIEDLLTYSRTNTSEKYFEKTDLNVVLEQVKTDLKEKITETSTDIFSDKLPEVKIIPHQFQQLFTNIISNSIKFSKNGMTPSIQIKSNIIDSLAITDVKGMQHDKYHHFAITDNGIGFKPEFNEQIFGLFQRLHGKNEYSGTGIGLAICKKIIENHNGIIKANGEPGKGATFNIYLPVL